MSSVAARNSGLVEAILAVSGSVRYCAVYREGVLRSAVREGLQGASSNESDVYEELIVNPTLLTLVLQRGNIDCGGARFVLIRYGNFFEYVAPIPGGHVSVGLEPDADPLPCVEAVQAAVSREGGRGH